MTQYNFNSDAEGWASTGPPSATAAWNGSDGSPAAGCMLASGTAVFDYLNCAISGLSIPVSVGDVLSFRYRLQGTIGGISSAPFLGASGGGLLGSATPGGAITLTTGDTGWQTVSGTISTAGTVDSLAVLIGDTADVAALTYAAFDTVFLGAGGAIAPDMRYLGIALDNDNLYVTSIKGGTLTYERSAFATLGIVSGSATFGTADYADPDTYTRGIWPVTIGDGQLYLYGRDGNNLQVQYNDLNGTLGWVTGGPGTATWATTKFCVALMPQAFFPHSVIAAFADDDIYLTVTGSAGWVKQGDAGTALRTAGRVTTTFPQILVAGQGTAQTYYSQNFGVSFGNAYSGLAGTVNAIEVSR